MSLSHQVYHGAKDLANDDHQGCEQQYKRYHKAEGSDSRPRPLVRLVPWDTSVPTKPADNDCQYYV